MGYDVKVTKTKFTRWFNIWNWHRLTALVLYGWGIFDDEGFQQELIAVNELKNQNLPTDPAEEKAFSVKMDDTEEETTEKTIINHDFDYDKDGLVKSGSAWITNPSKGIKNIPKDELESMVLGSVMMQARTNDLLIRQGKGVLLDKETCNELARMSGRPIEIETIAFLGIGSFIGLIRIGNGSDRFTGDSEIVSMLDKVIPGTEKTPDLSTMLDMANNWRPNFEIDEYWPIEDFPCIAAYTALMMDGLYSRSTIEIT